LLDHHIIDGVEGIVGSRWWGSKATRCSLRLRRMRSTSGRRQSTVLTVTHQRLPSSSQSVTDCTV